MATARLFGEVTCVSGDDEACVGSSRDEEAPLAMVPGDAGEAMDSLPEEDNTPETRIYRTVIASGLVIKSQQRDEPELSHHQKVEILSDLLRNKMGSFLMRFGCLLDAQDLAYFADPSTPNSSDYEVKFRVDELRKRLTSRAKEKLTKNRRYAALQELTETSGYFSEQEMRDRNPMLFEYYIGQYLTEKERVALDAEKASMPPSVYLMKKIEIDQRKELLRQQRNREYSTEEEEDESSSEDDDMTPDENIQLSSDSSRANQEKWMMRQEFLRAMQLSFLNGEDSDFDYAKVDRDERYDLLELQQKDAEDSYFDAEEPAWCEVATDDGMSGGGEVDTVEDHSLNGGIVNM